MKELDINEYCEFGSKLHTDWALITAGNEIDCNTMTIGWGGIGFLWKRQVFFAFVRKTRHTLKYTEDNDYFTISYFEPQYKQQLQYLGTHSGRDEDKISKVNFHPIKVGETVTFEEAKTTIVCKKLYREEIKKELLPKEIDETCYNNDYHIMYIGEIVKVIEK